MPDFDPRRAKPNERFQVADQGGTLHTFSADEEANMAIRGRSWGSATTDPSEWTYHFTPSEDAFGFPQLSDAEITAKAEAWVKGVNETLDVEKRKAIYAEAEEWLAGELDWDIGSPIDDRVVRRFGELVAAAADPIDDVRGSADYRRHALAVLAARTATWAWEDYRAEAS